MARGRGKENFRVRGQKLHHSKATPGTKRTKPGGGVIPPGGPDHQVQWQSPIDRLRKWWRNRKGPIL